jgi:LacI family transcriptional regulator, galactose operon repressor
MLRTRQKKALTIWDVARRARVSIAAVSHAFNSTGRIGPTTRRRILDVARKLKYFPNRHARNLASNRSRILGVIVSDIENPFFATAIRSFETRARSWNYEIITAETDYDSILMRRCARRMLEQNAAGVAILTSEMSRPLLYEIVRRNIPLACFDLSFKSQKTTNIQVDYASGMEQVIRHLFNFGHRVIAYVGGQQRLKNIELRHRYFVKYMQALGLDPSTVIPGNQRVEGGYEAGLRLLTLPKRPTAVVAMNDITAIGLIKAFYEQGLRVPEDISVTGFDNTYLAAYFQPRLTTVDMHPDVLGVTAAEALHQANVSPQFTARKHVIKIELVAGKSSGPAPGSNSAL